MSMITRAMRRILAADEGSRALDPNGQRLRSSARLPQAVRARHPANAVRAGIGSKRSASAPHVGLPDAIPQGASLPDALPDAIVPAAESACEPTPYVRDKVPEGAVWPQVVRGFA